MSEFTFNQAAIISYTTDMYGNVLGVVIISLDGPEMPENMPTEENDAYAEVLGSEPTASSGRSRP